MATRAWLGIFASGTALAAFFAPATLVLAATLAAVTALLAACTNAGENRFRPFPGLVWASALTLATVLGGAFLLKDRSPWGFLWLLGPGFVFAAPLFLSLFARSLRQP